MNTLCLHVFAAMTVGLLAWVNLATIAYFVESTELATFTYRLNFAAVVFFFLAAYKFYIEYFLGVKKLKLSFLNKVLNFSSHSYYFIVFTCFF